MKMIYKLSIKQLVLMMPVSVFVGLIIGLSLRVVAGVEYKEPELVVRRVKTQHRASIVLREGVDTRLQVVVPSWAYNSQYFDSVELSNE